MPGQPTSRASSRPVGSSQSSLALGTSAPPPGPHGGDAAVIARWLGIPPDDVLDLSASLNPVAPSLVPLITVAAGCLSRYPDDTAATTLLAAAIEVDPSRLVLTNGGAEAIALVARLEGAGWVEPPEFSLYERHLPRVTPGAPRWRSDPSNPLGLLAPQGASARVWDEAFWPLASGTWTAADRESAWRLGSLTKLWACPGLRIGYAIAPDAELAERLRQLRPAWSVNGLALAAVEAMLPRTDLAAWAGRIVELRGQLVDQLRRRGLTVRDSDANWVLVDEPGLRERLAPAAVVVRDCSSFGLAGTYRVAVPDDAGRARLLAALDATEPGSTWPDGRWRR